MIRLKQIEYFDLTEINLENNQIFSFNSTSQKFENSVIYTSTNDPNTIAFRDSNGRFRASNPNHVLDVVNLQTLNSKINEIDLSNFIGNSNYVTFDYNPSTELYQATVLAFGITGNIQKNVDGKLASSAYLNEDTTNGVLRLARTSQFFNNLKSSPILSISHNLNQNATPQISIETASYDITKGPKIEIYASYNTQNIQLALVKSHTRQNQSLFNLNINGFTSNVDTSPVFDLQFYSDSNFNTSVSGHFELHQYNTTNNDLIISSNSVGDIIFGNGLLVSNTSTESTGVIRYDGFHFQGYNGTNWLDLDLSTDNIATLNDITSTISVGGIDINETIPVGTTIEDFINRIVSPYIEPVIDTFVVNGDIYGQYIELGRVFTVNNAEFSIINDSNGDGLLNMSILGFGFDSSTEVITSPHNADSGSVELSISSVGPYSWILQGEDHPTSGSSPVNIINRTYTIYGRTRFSFGASPVSINESSSDLDVSNLINSLQQMWLIDRRDTQVTCTSDNKNTSNYTYIAYSVSYGQLDNILKSGLDAFGSFTLLGQFNYTNPYGNVTPFYVYKSNATGAFDSGNIINII